MKRVGDIATVAHNWANQIGDDAQASNLFFIGDNIYSYGHHFLIAKHVYNEGGQRAVLMTRRTYSSSTSAHINLVKNAARHLKILYVPNPDLWENELFERWYTQIKSIGYHLDNARKPAKYILEIQQVFQEAKNYADFFGHELPEILVEASHIENIDQYRDVLQKEDALRKEHARKSKAEALRIQKARLVNWRRFVSDRISTVDGYDYLRYNPVKDRIETTQDVEIPIAVGKQFYALVLNTIANGGCKDCPHKLMDLYQVLEINAKFIRVGCHKISLKEIKLFAKQQGWV